MDEIPPSPHRRTAPPDPTKCDVSPAGRQLIELIQSIHFGHPKLLDIDPVARALIQHKVRRLVGRCGYGISDQEDLEQDLALHAHRIARHFNPERLIFPTKSGRVPVRCQFCFASNASGLT